MVLEKFPDHLRVFGKSDNRSPYISWWKYSVLIPYGSGGSSIVGNGYDCGYVVIRILIESVEDIESSRTSSDRRDIGFHYSFDFRSRMHTIIAFLYFNQPFYGRIYAYYTAYHTGSGYTDVYQEGFPRRTLIARVSRAVHRYGRSRYCLPDSRNSDTPENRYPRTGYHGSGTADYYPRQCLSGG